MLKCSGTAYTGYGGAVHINHAPATPSEKGAVTDHQHLPVQLRNSLLIV